MYFAHCPRQPDTERLLDILREMAGLVWWAKFLGTTISYHYTTGHFKLQRHMRQSTVAGKHYCFVRVIAEYFAFVLLFAAS